MQQNFEYEQPWCHLVTPKPDFKIFVACENQSSLSQARRVREQIESLCCHDFEVSNVFWSFALFRSGQLRARAVLEAAAAEAVVVALSGREEFPAHAREWMESLPVRRQSGEAVLVAVIGEEQEKSVRRRSQIAYLKLLAASRGMDFLCNQAVGDGAELFTPAVSLLERAESWPGDNVFREMAWSTGGINE